MKVLSLFAISALLFSSLGHAAFRQRNIVRESRVEVSSCLNLRSRATSRSNIQSCVARDTSVEILRHNPNGYSQVRVGNKVGYLWSDYLSRPRQVEMSSLPDAEPLVSAPVIREGVLSGASAQALWGNRPSWNQATLEAIRQNWSNLQSARDVENFCPGYRRASRSEQENCWLLIVSGLAKFETVGFNPNDTSPEGAPLYYNSVGLLQLSHNRRARECVKEGARSEQDLKKAELNLRCGTRILANLVKKHGRIAGRPGVGSYWSVMQRRGQHRAAKAETIASLASRDFNNKVAGRFPDRAIASATETKEVAMANR